MTSLNQTGRDGRRSRTNAGNCHPSSVSENSSFWSKSLKYKDIKKSVLSIGRKKMHSSLFYQIVSFFNWWVLALFVILEIALLLFKTINLPYPGSYLACDIILVSFTFILEYFRIDLSRSGNLTEKQLPLVVSIPIGITSVLGSVYILLWQTYVLRIELIMAIFQLVFQGIEILHTCILIIGFHQSSSLT